MVMVGVAGTAVRCWYCWLALPIAIFMVASAVLFHCCCGSHSGSGAFGQYRASTTILK
jgi:hypothetical protein